MRKILLCILDGFGVSSKTEGNAVVHAPLLTKLVNSKNTVLLEASGKYVGLPNGQCGNSEVGHLTLGSGRIMKQKLPRIAEAIADGSLECHLSTLKPLQDAQTIHLLGLFSPGGIHSDINHYIWAIKYLRSKGKRIECHLFLDGRDTGQKDALGIVQAALQKGDIRHEEIATLCGRYFAMDRDNRMDRTQKAFDAIVNAKAGIKAKDPIAAIEDSYSRDIFDEMMPPVVMEGFDGASESDLFWMINFRTDRIKQILRLLIAQKFPLINMVPCGDDIDPHSCTLFPPQDIRNTLGEILSSAHIPQLRVAETEKYAHVTYFFNGGKEVQFPGEDRILVPSPKVADYAETPDMSTAAIRQKIEEAMAAGQHKVIIANFASPDMIGHTGNFNATCEALQKLDAHIDHILQAAKNNDFTVLVTADHGNAEDMINPDGSPQKSHTQAQVPFIIIPEIAPVRATGELSDVAPTILSLLGLPIPPDMTGRSLLKI